MPAKLALNPFPESFHPGFDKVQAKVKDNSFGRPGMEQVRRSMAYPTLQGKLSTVAAREKQMGGETSLRPLGSVVKAEREGLEPISKCFGNQYYEEASVHLLMNYSLHNRQSNANLIRK